MLNKELAVGHLIVPTSAVRDEGTSYHYVAIFISKDKGLNEIRCAYQLKCLFLNRRTGKTYPFYQMMSLNEEQSNKYLSPQAVKQRMSSATKKLDGHIENLKAQIIELTQQ